MTKLSNILLLLSFTLGAWSSATIIYLEPDPQNIIDYDFMEKDRDTIINKLRTETTCDELDGQDKCEELYDNLYQRILKKEKCEELRDPLIEHLHELIEITEVVDDLEDIHYPFFSIYLNFVISCINSFPILTLTPDITDITEHELKPVRTEEEYEKIRNQDPDRDKVIKETRKRYSGDVCENLDEENRYDCEGICSFIYMDKGDRNECKKLEVSLIEDLEEVYEALEDGDEDDFWGIDSELFDVYLNVGISGLDNIIRDYSRREAKEFLFWLIEDPDISYIFIKEDSDYKTLIALFKAIESGYLDSGYDEKNEIWTVFNKNIDSSDSLMEIVIDSGSKELMGWFLSYINNVNPACYNDTKSEACFEVYCNIGKDLGPNEQDDWHEDFEDFQDYLDDIISEKTNQDHWKPETVRSEGSKEDDFENLDDLLDEQSSNDTWVDALCANVNDD